MSGRRTNTGTEEEGYCPTHWLSSLWNAMYPFHYLGKKAFETVLSSQGQKGWKRPLVPKGKSPLILLCIHVPSWKASTTFTCQSICNFFPVNSCPANYICPQDKGLWGLTLLALWPRVHWLPGPLPTLYLPPWPLATLTFTALILLDLEPMPFSPHPFFS